MLNAVLNNLINIGWAMLIFLCAYLSNVAFSLYYNIKVLLQPFDRQKMINSGLKVATFVVGLTLLCVAITTLPIYADQLGWAIPEEYTEIFADLVIVGAVLMVSCKYIAEAFTKFRAILQVKGDTEMSNSPLATYTRITKNKTSPRNHAIDTITIHCIVGQWTAKQGCDYFATTDRQCSANYVVGKDGSIGLSVDEKDRSWCSSNGTNDNRAITIEVASDTTHPYAVTAKAYAALLDLVTDICKRNGIKKLVWSTNKNDRVNHRNGCNMTVHRDFANKACPGEYLYSRHGEIAAEVNRRLQGASDGGGVVVTPPAAEKPTGGTTGATVTPYHVRVKITNLNIRKGPGTNYGATGYIQPGIYTIVAESTGKGAAKWGKLKSGAGWISLDYATKT